MSTKSAPSIQEPIMNNVQKKVPNKNKNIVFKTHFKTISKNEHLKNLKQKKERRWSVNEEGIKNFFKVRKKHPLASLFTTPSKFGEEGKDVTYDRFIASRQTSPLCSSAYFPEISHNIINSKRKRRKKNENEKTNSGLDSSSDGNCDLIKKEKVDEKLDFGREDCAKKNCQNQSKKKETQCRRDDKNEKEENNEGKKSNSEGGRTEKKQSEGTRSQSSSETAQSPTERSRSPSTSSSSQKSDRKIDLSPPRRSAVFCKPLPRLLTFQTPKKRPNKSRPRIRLGEAPKAGPALRRALFSAPPRRKKIPNTPYRTLDAPGIGDNFYLRLLDWSSRNFVAVGLSRTVYIYGVESHSVNALLEKGEGDPVATALSWEARGKKLCVGFSTGLLELWDPVAEKMVRRMRRHIARVGTIGWSGNLLASGSKDRSISIVDPRTAGGTLAKLSKHKQEVCGVRWSPFKPNILASGGNDNKLCVWDISSKQTLHEYTEHTAAVRAIDWSFHQPDLLATGGGTGDNTVRLWDTKKPLTNSIDSINCESQVCDLRWSTNSEEFATTHGYPQNQIQVFEKDEKGIKRLAKLSGHSGRVLQLSLSPDGTSIVTGSSDETLKFWKVFPENKETKFKSFLPKSRLRVPELR